MRFFTCDKPVNYSALIKSTVMAVAGFGCTYMLPTYLATMMCKDDSVDCSEFDSYVKPILFLVSVGVSCGSSFAYYHNETHRRVPNNETDEETLGSVTEGHSLLSGVAYG